MSNVSDFILDFVSVREIQADDVHFVLDSFITCLSRYDESIVKGFDHHYSKKYLEKLMLYVLQSGKYSVFICSNKDEPTNIYAYIIGDPTTNYVFFNYTKYLYRPYGLQKYLLLPLILDPSQPVVVEWPTKEMLKAKKAGKVTIEHRIMESFIDEAT